PERRALGGLAAPLLLGRREEGQKEGRDERRKRKRGAAPWVIREWIHATRVWRSAGPDPTTNPRTAAPAGAGHCNGLFVGLATGDPDVEVVGLGVPASGAHPVACSLGRRHLADRDVPGSGQGALAGPAPGRSGQGEPDEVPAPRRIHRRYLSGQWRPAK